MFVITEDWFFHSHFLPMAKAALAQGYTVGVAARYHQHRDAIEALGVKAIDLSLNRGRYNPLGALTLIARLYRLFRYYRPDLVHHISLKPIILGSIAARLARVPVMVNAITGFGYLFAIEDPRFNAIRAIIRRLLSVTVGAPSSFALLENRDDQRHLIDSRIAAKDRITIVDGAGVDGDSFRALPLPSRPTNDNSLRVAVVARMLWSKGIDLAVRAVQLAREQNPSVTLTLVGAPDPLNPHAIPEDRLREWDTLPGIEWVGHRADVREVWAQHDVALLLSRGGEGLPRSLIEAAACGRPVVTTNVPGCKEIVVDGKTGRLLSPDQPEAIAAALVDLAGYRRADLAVMAQASREHFESRFTEAAVTSRVTDLYRTAFDWAQAAGRLADIKAL